MNTPANQITDTRIGEKNTRIGGKIRTSLTRPGLAFTAAAAIGLGLAGAAATADAASAASTGPTALAATGVSPIGGLDTSVGAGLGTSARTDGGEPAEHGDRERDKRSGDEDKTRKGESAKDEKSKRDSEDRKTRPAWVSPMPDAKTTSCFGPRWGTQHKGLDLAQPENSPVNAAGAGTVTAAGWIYQGYGISVVVDHGDGHLTHYAHLNRTTVEVGDEVKAGDRIGVEGNTGDSTGPHLHFEVHRGMWNQLDPGQWMKQRGVDLKC